VCKDFGPEQSRNLRARAWAYVFNRYEAKKKAGEENAGDGMKGLEHDHPARRILPR
jgi:hypothetical protein